MFDFVYFFIEVKFQEVYFIFLLITVIFTVFLISMKERKKVGCYCYCYGILISIIISNIIIICLYIMIVLFVINFGRFRIVLYGFGCFIFIALIVQILDGIFITFSLVSSYMIKFISKAIVFIILFYLFFIVRFEYVNLNVFS
jgi:hypothetical protein